MSERIRIGIVHRHHFAVGDGYGHDWEFANFTLGAEAISFWQIFDSAFATPSRYIQEIFRRLFKLDEGAEPSAKFVFNPLFSADWLAVSQALAVLDGQAPFPGISVLTDQDGVPVGYLFPPWLDLDESRYLTLLSAVDGEMDASLCRQLFLCDVQCVPVAHLSMKRVEHHGFVYDDNIDIYRWTAERAMAVLEPLTGLPPAEAARRRNAIPFTAIMPHHAGDALFFGLAWSGSKTHIERLAVNKAYCDIVADVAPTLALIPIKQPPANRDDDFRQGKVTSEQDYFRAFMDALPTDSFYCYCRPSRDYNLSRFHLIDHFAFAIGRQSCAVDELISRRHQQALFRPDIPPEPVRVLLHFDAGWPLKVYPKGAQERLIDLLYDRGYRITVLAGAAYEHPKCRVTTFQDYPRFTELVKSHHILVGMDSFPSHYAAHVLGLPAICLFASTRPENADAPGTRNYAALEKGLRCRPCYGINRCRVYGTDYCQNFVDPEIVAAEIGRMLESVRNEPVVESAVAPPWTGDDCPATAPDGVARIKRISLRHLRAKVLVLGLVMPYFRYGAMLYREFAAAVGREGFLSATFRVLRFLRRAARR